MIGDLAENGRLRDVRFPKILTRLQRLKKTGVLVLERNDQNKTIFVQDGDIIFAASKYQDDWLGERLLKAGKITLKQYLAASEIAVRTRKRLGTVLVELDAIKPKDLFLSVSTQVKEIILSLFTWIDGAYDFKEGPLPAQEVITLRMSTANLILDGIRRINDFVRLRSEIPPLETVLQLTADPIILFQDINLTDKEQAVLALIDVKNSVLGIFNESELPPFDTLKLIHFFLVIGLAEALVTQKAEEPLPVEEPAPQVEAAVKMAEPSLVKPREGPVQEGGQEEVLKEDKEELVQEVKMEQQEAVRERHEEIFGKAAQGIQFTKQKIQEAYEALPHQDHYEVLGLQKTVTRDELKRAYFRLAKEYHPDRHFQSGLEDLPPLLEALFRRITEAYDTLLMERKRKEYDTGLAMKQSKARRVFRTAADGAAEQASSGERALKKGDLKTAAYHFEAAVKASPKTGRYQALFARTLSKIPGRQKDAETAFLKAIELEPATLDHRMELGRLYSNAGMAQRALRQFEEIMKWEPTNAAVKAELDKLKK